MMMSYEGLLWAMRGCDECTHLQGYDLRRSILCLVRLLHECSLRLLQLVHVERELLLLVVGLVLQHMHDKLWVAAMSYEGLWWVYPPSGFRSASSHSVPLRYSRTERSPTRWLFYLIRMLVVHFDRLYFAKLWSSLRIVVVVKSDRWEGDILLCTMLASHEQLRPLQFTTSTAVPSQSATHQHVRCSQLYRDRIRSSGTNWKIII